MVEAQAGSVAAAWMMLRWETSIRSEGSLGLRSFTRDPSMIMSELPPPSRPMAFQQPKSNI